MSTSIAADAGLFEMLNGIPNVDISRNLQAAISAGRRMTSILREVVSLRRAPGKLTPNEYFYYRLWDPALSAAEKRRFAGKQAEHQMHLACNDSGWYAAAADKLLFQILMAGSMFPVPPLLAVTQAVRRAGEARTLRNSPEIARFLREPQIYPLFAKPVAGKYSLSVISADRYDAATDEVLLLGGERKTAESLAADLAGGTGYMIQRRLDPDTRLARLFRPRLWSVRALVLAGPSNPVMHRAVAKIATGSNAADNFWRQGTMLGAIELETGIITRVLRGIRRGDEPQRGPSRHKAADRRHLDAPMGGACAPGDLSGRDPAGHPHPILGCRARRRGAGDPRGELRRRPQPRTARARHRCSR
jgi:hypothetical protein